MRLTSRLLRSPTVICTLGMAITAAVPATGVQASFTISSGATKKMTCAGGTCSPTKTSAVLNVSSLESMLATGNVTVTTTGSGNVQANNIAIDAALTWSSSGDLTLTAHQSISFDAGVSVAGKGGLVLNDAGEESLAFYNGANVTFSKLSSSLVVNGNAYTLVASIAGLSSAVQANPDADYALANDYDASGDGTYAQSPVNEEYTGMFEGLGHTISNLTIVDGTNSGASDGLFTAINGQINDIGLANVSVRSTGTQGANGVGTVAGTGGQSATVWRSYATGSVNTGLLSNAGGLTAAGGSFIQSWANVAINCSSSCNIGGLTGGSGGTINQSFSMGSITTEGANIGGLTGGTGENAEVLNSYSMTSITVTDPNQYSNVGGLVGNNGGVPDTLEQSYAAGTLIVPGTNCSNDCVGGVIGVESCEQCDPVSKVYWDTTTSGTKQATGNLPDDPRQIKGLTTKKFIASLPKGFKTSVWAQDRKVNGGFPYLIANPPPN